MINLFKRSLTANIIAITGILTIVSYVTIFHSPCPEGDFIYSKDDLSKWCEAIDEKGMLTKHGPWVSLYQNGSMRERGEFHFGQKHGHWVAWYNNGHKQNEGEMIDNLPVGKWSQWDDQGNKLSESQNNPSFPVEIR